MFRNLGYLGTLCPACTANENLIGSSRYLVSEVALRVADKRARIANVNASAAALDRELDILRDYFAEGRTLCHRGDLLVPFRRHATLNNVMRLWYWISWKKSLILKQALLGDSGVFKHAHFLSLGNHFVGRAHA